MCIRDRKGGDPAAPSGTATLLRLRPNRQPHLRRLPPLRVGPPASGVADFRDVTGGVYEARERIHRSVADLRLLAIPTSWGRVAAPMKSESLVTADQQRCGHDVPGPCTHRPSSHESW